MVENYSRRPKYFIHAGSEDERDKTRAVALGYNPDADDAPLVVASGQDHVAKKIIEIAKANHIPIQEDTVLTAALSTLDVGSAIPPELYLVVAEVFAYVYRIREARNGR